MNEPKPVLFEAWQYADLRHWKCEAVELVPPCQQNDLDSMTREARKFWLKADGRPQCPAFFSAERGFPSLLAPELSRLWTAERVKPGTRKPAAERPLLLGLLSHYFPDLDKNAIDAIIALRKTLAAGQIKESIFTEGDAYKQLEDLSDQGDAEAVQEHLESAGYGRASGSGDRPPPRVPMADLGVTDLAPHMSQAWASEFIPKRVGCTISKDVLWHFRWVGQYREKATPPYYFSKCWSTNDASGVKEALALVLEQLWLAHMDEVSDEPCPFDLHNLPAPEAPLAAGS